MAISYICNRDKTKRNVTIQFLSVKIFEENSDRALKKIKNINKKCRELNSRITEIAICNRSSLLPLDFCVKKEKINDLKTLK